MNSKNWFNILLVAVSGFYFGYLHGRMETEGAVAPGEIMIEGRKILIPRDVYDTVKALIEKI